DGAEDREHGVAGLSRAGKSMVEAAAARAGRRDEQTVERGATALVRIEAVAHELAQEASALRVAKGDTTAHQRRVLAQRRDGRAMFEVRRKVAHGCEPEHGHR